MLVQKRHVGASGVLPNKDIGRPDGFSYILFSHLEFLFENLMIRLKDGKEVEGHEISLD
ncbi:MAG: hypothetical protein GU354_04870 [Caldimicrobium sp.]|jgi:hypothetical protein|nr:hypothetical protein [Caldimicrobium sp.]